jgi:chromosome segregation ATPase
MKKKFYNGMLMVVMLIAAVGSFVSCKDYDEDAFADLQGQLVTQDSTLKELITSEINVLTEQIEALEQAQELCKQNCEAWRIEINNLIQQIQNDYVTKEEYNKHILEYTKKIAALEAEDKRLEGLINAINTEVADIKKRLDKNETDIKTLFTDLNTLTQTTVQ